MALVSMSCFKKSCHRDIYFPLCDVSCQSVKVSVYYRINPSLLTRELNKSLFTSQVKVAILKYIESLARQMDPTDFVNSSETRLAVSRIITWTTEPKSSDVRKVISRDDEVFAVIIVLPKKTPNPTKTSHKGNEKYSD